MDSTSIKDSLSAQQGREILLVEDSDADARLVRRSLQLAGVTNHLRHFAHGKEAMSYLMQATQVAGKPAPSVFLLDLKLPGVNGFEILQWLQHHPEFSHSLKVVLSQLDQIDNIRKAYSLGAHSFLSKPFCQEDLHELITFYPDYWVLSQPAATDSLRSSTLSRR